MVPKHLLKMYEGQCNAGKDVIHLFPSVLTKTIFNVRARTTRSKQRM